MNLSDSERVAAVCRSMGYTPSPDDKQADLYVINTCSVRQKAEDRVIGMGKQFFQFKKDRPDVKVVLTGCMAKRDIRQGYEKSVQYQDKYAGNLIKKMPWLDFVLEINDMHRLPDILGVEVKDKVEDYFGIRPKYNSTFQAFVPISTGCNKFCTFCIVPFTRGKEIYRPFQEIYDEVKALVDAGFKEITLLGQNVNSWRSSNEQRTPITPLLASNNVEEKEEKQLMDFADLMERLARIPGDFWLRFTSSHPYDINPRLIEVIANEPRIAKQVHFALQSGSNSVLKRMNRYYTRDEFREKVLQIKKAIPGVAMTTDVIVGFSGETDEEFNETLDLCKELRFDQIYISEYSRREGTIAAKFYEDDIDHQVKTKRKIDLDEVLKAGVEINNKALVGSVQKVLICKTKMKNRSGIFGKTTHGKDILINVQAGEQGKCGCGDGCGCSVERTSFDVGAFVEVIVTGYRGFCLEGRTA